MAKTVFMHLSEDDRDALEKRLNVHYIIRQVGITAGSVYNSIAIARRFKGTPATLLQATNLLATVAFSVSTKHTMENDLAKLYAGEQLAVNRFKSTDLLSLTEALLPGMSIVSPGIALSFSKQHLEDPKEI